MNSPNNMDISNKMPTAVPSIDEFLKTSLQRILDKNNLDKQRVLTKNLVTELDVDFLDFSAALLYLYQQPTLPVNQEKSKQIPSIIKHPGIKMIRYRLEIGHKHQVTQEQLTKVLVEESGVDKNNINIIDIQSLCTFIELPDEMPHDIFFHLKMVEINQHKLDIKRIKNCGHKGRTHDRNRRARQRKPK